MTTTENGLDSRPVRVLERAEEAGRLAHAILLYGESLPALEAVAQHFAGRLLGGQPERVLQHPDCFALRPQGRARQIRIGASGGAEMNTMRKFIRDIAMTSNQGGGKVGIVYEVDRMNASTANAFLKTLEEPPAETWLFLLTTRPYDLLDTIRSRCVNIRLPADLAPVADRAWQDWRQQFEQWLAAVLAGPSSAGDAASLLLRGNGLIVGFTGILDRLAEARWQEHKSSLPAEMTDEQKAALQVGLSKGIRDQLFKELEDSLARFGHQHLSEQDPATTARRLAQSVGAIEHASGLLNLNLKEDAALETVILNLLRIWSRG